MFTRPSLLVALAVAAVARAGNFSFTYTEPKACDDITVSWNGGEPPYSLFVIPKFSVPINISIPDDGRTKFTTKLSLNENASFVLTMSDKSGFGSGGSSPLLTPKPSGNNSCITDTNPPFTFSLPIALQQCGTFQFANYNGASFPLTFIGIIPLGIAFPLVTNDRNMFNWNANIKAGTQIIWVAQDAKGRSGGTSDLLTVQLSDNTSCLKGNIPSATTTVIPKFDGSNNTSAIIGGAVGGGLAGVLIMGGALFLFLKKRRYSKPPPHKGGLDDLDPTPFSHTPARGTWMQERHHVRPMSDADEHAPSPYPTGPVNGNLEPNPYVFPSSTSSETTGPRSRPQSQYQSNSQTQRSSKAGMSMGTPRTPRFILHTDAEDAEEPEEDEVVELPPQYKPSRGQQLPTVVESSGSRTTQPQQPAESSQPPFPPESHHERREPESAMPEPQIDPVYPPHSPGRAF